MLNREAEADADAGADFDPFAQLADCGGDTQSFSSRLAATYADVNNVNASADADAARDSQAADAPTSTALNVFTLRAANYAALASMRRLTEVVTSQPLLKSYEHARQFIQFDPPQSAASALGLRDSSPLSVPSSFAAGQDNELSVPSAQPSSPSIVSHAPDFNAIVNSCSWLVSLAHVIRDPKLGWVLGRDDDKADLPLKPNSPTMVRLVHASFRYDPSGQLQLYALRKGVTLDGVTLPEGEKRTLHAESHNIGIADMSFTFQSARRRDEDSAFRQHLQHWAHGLDLDIHPHKYLCATPKHVDILAGRYRVLAVVGVGGLQSINDGRTTIFGGVDDKTNTAVAIKTCKRLDQRSANAVADEAAIYRNITSAMPAPPSVADFVLRLHDEVPPILELPIDQRDTVHLVFSPLADSDLHSYAFGTQSYLDVPTAIAQCLLAVQWLHSIGWIHRDIKPSNIGVRSHPFRIVLLDLAQAINPKTSPDACVPRPGTLGTLGYLAPELENAAFCPSPASPKYDSKVDIFSLGVVALDLLHRPPSHHQDVEWTRNPNPFLNKHGGEYQRFKSAIARLRCSDRLSPEFLISQMLEPYPTMRLDADSALRHPFLETAVKEQRMQLEKAKEAQTQPGEKRQRSGS
ncbi:uncharacterized protein MYCFIDRAFT_217161 [Pseudocercospora fijiensis CIRAD86]|uniref:Protein kinase domain-containing protein n=1 Tax=Pseudocercospora fijiensis (strain CIRAD86) TaxID=383855 RepID=M3AHV3_PSEFD|nr:uncharacterized protein MYCFIDRAFT_217161 [Pseudocercospora fijiensis CIRAD86]EME76773.1 hypothetical protein MYCFIDRAFT_217161 [Pseudocercospora fijiensis CIRAD86]